MSNTIHNPQYRPTAGQQAAMYYARKRNRNKVLADDPTLRTEGDFTFSVNPSTGNYLDIDGTIVTFGIQINIGLTLALTLANLLGYLQASTDPNISKATYSVTGGNKLVVVDKTPGDQSFTISAG